MLVFVEMVRRVCLRGFGNGMNEQGCVRNGGWRRLNCNSCHQPTTGYGFHRKKF